MRFFKKPIILTCKSRIEGEYGVMPKCDGTFTILHQRHGNIFFKNCGRSVFLKKATNRFDFQIYAETIDYKTFFAFDTSMEENYKERYKALKSVSDETIVVLEVLFTDTPLKNLKQPKHTFPCDGLVLVSVNDSTPNYKWKSIQTVDFFIDEYGNCIVGWLASDPLPFNWSTVLIEKSVKSYVGIAFGDCKGPHKYIDSVEKAKYSVVECCYKGDGRWKKIKTRKDKTDEYNQSSTFAGANNWYTAESALCGL